MNPSPCCVGEVLSRRRKLFIVEKAKKYVFFWERKWFKKGANLPKATDLSKYWNLLNENFHILYGSFFPQTYNNLHCFLRFSFPPLSFKQKAVKGEVYWLEKVPKVWNRESSSYASVKIL